MTDGPLSLLIDVVCWATVLFAVYTVVLLGLDALLAARQRRQHVRQQHTEAIARIHRDATDTIERIGAALTLAQQLLRDEAAVGKEKRT